MTHELEAIIEKLQEAKAHVLDLKARQISDPDHAESVEDVELALEWAIKKLRGINEQAP